MELFVIVKYGVRDSVHSCPLCTVFRGLKQLAKLNCCEAKKKKKKECII